MDITQDFVLAAAALNVNFEPPDYQGSPTGIRVTGQQGWYVPPVAGSTDQFVFTYDGNALGLTPDPNGDTQFVGYRVTDVNFLGRAQLNYDWSATTVWTVSYDFTARFAGTPPPADFIGSFSLQDSNTTRSFIAVNSWGTNTQGTMWEADYLVYNPDGTQTQVTPGPEWRGLPVNHWFRESTSFDFDSNRILSVSITDLNTGNTATVNPTNWYLLGGATGRPPLPTALRFFVGGGAPGNIQGYDNLVVESGAPGYKPGQNQSQTPLVKPLVEGAATN
jgi:hypothetical protein